MTVVGDALALGVFVGLGLVVVLGLLGGTPSRRRAREKALRRELDTLRQTIDQYRSDCGRYPDALGDLVRKGYLRRLPVDPMTGSRLSWIEIRAAGCPRARVVDVRSAFAGKALDGTEYGSW